MKLSSTFPHEGWNIKYTVSTPSTSTRQNLKTILFVHGTPWSSQVFIPLAKSVLATHNYRIILYDLPGYGESQAQDSTQKSSEDTLKLFKQDMHKDTSVKFQAAALAALISRLELSSPPLVIAHDIAGSIVLRTHLLHNVNFASMMLLETNCILPWGDGFYKLVRSNPEVFVQLPPTIFESVVRAVIRSASHNPDDFPKSWEDTLAKPWIERAEEWRQRSFVRQIAQADDEDVKEMLDQKLYEEVRCDVKIVWGESDAWIPKHKMERLREMLGEKCKEFIVVPEAGHLVMVDQPERVMSEVLRWVGRP